VVLQHLAPEHESMLTELLQRVTDMHVIEIVEGTPVAADRVYVAPAGHGIELRDETLHLVYPSDGKAPTLPIDDFFRSLAIDQRERAVCVVLSGMGSDGMVGATAVHDRSGYVFAQEPSSAQFDSMPAAVIASGVCRDIAPPEELAQLVVEQIELRLANPSGAAPVSIDDDAGIDSVIQTIRSRNGHDFSLYKRTTLVRRIERRMMVHGIDDTLSYAQHLQENPQEVDLLFSEMLIGVTNFFRDPEVWEHLRSEVLPQLIERCGDHGVIRAWSAGCSTGEEAYSLAMSLVEAIEAQPTPMTCAVQIFASDLDAEAIERARAGEYPATIASEISPERLARFFEPVSEGYRVSPALRKHVVFATHNVLMDPPFSNLDLIVCRNLLIYLQGDVQRRLLTVFHRCLRQDGVLMLGLAESVGSAEASLSEIPGRHHTYRHLSANEAHRPALQTFTGKAGAIEVATLSTVTPVPTMQALTDHLIVTRHGPAAVLTNDQGDIVYFSGRTGAFLEPAAGKANLNVFAMAREGIRLALHDAFTAAVRDQEETRAERLPLVSATGTSLVDLVVQPISSPPELRGLLLLVFTPSNMNSSLLLQDTLQLDDQPPSADDRSAALSEELLRLRAALESAAHDAQYSRERLQATIEELQSTNEELTTSKEEMQSMNEELQTVNNELQRRVAALSLASDDMANLITSSSVATLYLDNELCVRRFTSATVGLFNLIPSDQGRPIVDLASTLDHRLVVADAREVMRTLTLSERHMGADDGRWFNVRIAPYRTQEDRFDGVVITFIDATKAHTAEAVRMNALDILRGEHDGDHASTDDRIAAATAVLSASPSRDTDETKEAR